MSTILVPTDFTDAAKNASNYAARLAKDLQSSVILFHAYHVAFVPTADAPMAINIDPTELQNDNLTLLQQEANSLIGAVGVEIECIAKEGFAVDEILQLENEKKPDLIIMGLSAVGAVSEFLLGSIATDVMGKTNTPVIIVPEKASYQPIKKIAFASDYETEIDTDELKTLKHIIKMCNAKLYILNVEKEKEDIEVDKAIQMMKMENHFDDIEHTHHLPIDDDLIHGLKSFIAEHEIDMIAMIPHKHNLLSRMFKESNTKKMAFHSEIPLLTLHSSHRNNE